jgi:thioester reductase-like protein
MDAIYHCGAVVNFLYPYQALKPANVQGTASLLELASRERPKLFHYISTLSVFPPTGSQQVPVLAEDDALSQSSGFRTGYAQSKWVAEKMVAAARERGLQVAIYRLGTVTGHSGAGTWNTTDFVCRTLKSYVQLGSMPSLEGLLDFIPVDFAAKAIAHLSLRRASAGKVFHFANPRPAPAGALHTWLESIGYPLRRISYAEWFEELRRDALRSDRNALFALLPLITGLQQDPNAGGPLHPFSSTRSVDCRNTYEGLAGSGIECPPVEEALVRTYVKYFVESGFLPKEPGRREPT